MSHGFFFQNQLTHFQKPFEPLIAFWFCHSWCQSHWQWYEQSNSQTLRFANFNKHRSVLLHTVTSHFKFKFCCVNAHHQNDKSEFMFFFEIAIGFVFENRFFVWLSNVFAKNIYWLTSLSAEHKVFRTTLLHTRKPQNIEEDFVCFGNIVLETLQIWPVIGSTKDISHVLFPVYKVPK